MRSQFVALVLADAADTCVVEDHDADLADGLDTCRKEDAGSSPPAAGAGEVEG